MSSNTRQELETILQEVYTSYHKFSSDCFYYKLKNEKKIKMECANSPDENEYRRISSDILFRRDLEYLLYVSTGTSVSPSWHCLIKKSFYDALDQFIPATSDLEQFLSPLFFLNYKDPLSQLFGYNYLLSGNGQRHIYLCPVVLLVEPYGPDPSSIFKGKKGIIAYCTEFIDLIRSTYDVITGDAIQEFEEIYNRASDNIEALFNEEGHMKACNVDIIINAIHDEIEEANKLMQRYGIMRVTLPLD